MAYMCPVCGYGMEDPPENYNICSCCGTEFGLHDANSSLDTLRAEWLRSGATWWSQVDPVPEGWDPYVQVNNVLHRGTVWPLALAHGQHGGLSLRLLDLSAGRDRQVFGQRHAAQGAV